MAAAARMMRWRPWPPGAARKYRVRLVVQRMEGSAAGEKAGRVTAVVRWKGAARRPGLGALRRAVARRNCTRGEEVGEGGEVVWDEEFESVCTISGAQPWEVVFQVFNDMNQPKDKASVIGTASLNLTEFTSAEEIEIKLPLLPAVLTTESHPSLHLTLSLLELRAFQEPSETLQRSPAPVSPLSDSLPSEKDEISAAFKAGLRKVKILTELVSARKTKKKNQDDESSEGRSSATSDDRESIYPFDTDSLDDDPDEGESQDGKDDSSIRKSFGYGTLASANYVGSTSHTDMIVNGDYEDWVYYSHHRSDAGCSHTEKTLSASEQYIIHKSILPWKKRKFNLRSPKNKGEPLLKRAYGDEGGDDIDYDRRQLSSSDESLSIVRRKVDGDGTTNHLSASEFGDDSFEIGSWETKKLVSRDGHMKLSTQVFFASIDQRSERAAGESACTALVAVIADWFQTNKDLMPIKSQFDSLIREGSLKWRNLCKNETYRERFPDKHFDLETVLQAKICPLSVVSEKSFIGFFHPEATGDNSGFDFLQGAMSFDSIWDEISRAASECPSDGSPHLYIVSWNDHFFVLKVERNAYYILDTLGERLYEGCNQAYVLKFDDSTSIHKIRSENKDGASVRVKSGSQQTQEKENTNTAGEEELVCKGKESCKEYIKSFLAAIPIRELQTDIKKALMDSTLLHQRLQIEFHYTETAKTVSEMKFKPVAENTTSEFPIPAEAFTQTLAVVVV